MKVVGKNEEEITLILETTSSDVEEVKEITLPRSFILQWYPLNMNYTYKYAKSKNMMYLVKDPTYKGEQIYETKLLKFAKELPLHHGVPLNQSVYDRNKEVLAYATDKHIINPEDVWTKEYLNDSVLKTIQHMKDYRNVLQKRFILAVDEFNEELLQETNNKEGLDEILYSYATEEELKELNMIGEVYTMVNLLRRLKD